MAFAEDYVPVAERLAAFRAAHPEGSLQSEIVELNENRVVIRALAYRSPDDPRPGIGHSAMAIPGRTTFTRGSELENCETSAWGRALAALAFEVKRGIASGEEVRNKQDDGPPPQRIKAATGAEVEAFRDATVKAMRPTSSVEIEAKRKQDARDFGKVSEADYGRILEAGARISESEPERYAAFTEWIKSEFGNWGGFVHQGGARVADALAILTPTPTVAEQVAAFAPEKT